MKKKAKAWAIAWSACGAAEFGVRGHRIITDSMKCTDFKESSGSFEVYDIFKSKREAEAFLLVSNGDFEIIPVEIHYSLPKKK